MRCARFKYDRTLHNGSLQVRFDEGRSIRAMTVAGANDLLTLTAHH
jgi:hypothetical protein